MCISEFESVETQFSHFMNSLWTRIYAINVEYTNKNTRMKGGTVNQVLFEKKKKTIKVVTLIK